MNAKYILVYSFNSYSNSHYSIVERTIIDGVIKSKLYGQYTNLDDALYNMCYLSDSGIIIGVSEKEIDNTFIV